MLTPEDRQMGVVFWIVGGCLALFIAVCVRKGRVRLSYWEKVRCDENPRAFWFHIGLLGLVLVGFVWTALYFTLPEPGPW